MVDAEAGEGASEEPKRPAMSSRWLDADLEEDPNAGEVGKVRHWTRCSRISSLMFACLCFDTDFDRCRLNGSGAAVCSAGLQSLAAALLLSSVTCPSLLLAEWLGAQVWEGREGLLQYFLCVVVQHDSTAAICRRVG
jgi:hypothetical protein